MHPRFEELIRHLDGTRADLRSAIDGVAAAHRTTRPANGGWSAIGVLEHLAIIEPRLTGMLAQKLGEARSAGLRREDDTSPVAPRLGVEKITDRSYRIEASAAAQPTQERDLETVWQALEGSRAKLKTLLADFDGLALGDVQHPHPALGTLDGYQWIGFVGAHEARHAAQIREIGASFARS